MRLWKRHAAGRRLRPAACESTPKHRSRPTKRAAPARHPGEGPAFFAEVDRRFWAQTHYKVGGRLDPHNPADRAYVRIWLRIRDQVRAEREQAAQVTQGEQPAQQLAAQADGNGAAPAAPEPPVAGWIPDQREETPIERGVTDLVDKYVCHPDQTDWWVDALVNPPRRGT